MNFPCINSLMNSDLDLGIARKTIITFAVIISALITLIFIMLIVLYYQQK